MLESLRKWAGIVLTLAAIQIVMIGLIAGDGDAPDRALQLARELRCPVCDGQSIADAASAEARALRHSIDEQIASGRSDAEIIDLFVATYGDWILLDPPLGGITSLLWILPVMAAIGGIFALRRLQRPAAAERTARSRGIRRQ